MRCKKRNKLLTIIVAMMIIERLHNLTKTGIMWSISLSKTLIQITQSIRRIESEH